MQLKCDGASFILQANTRSGGRYGAVLTIGLLVDAQGQPVQHRFASFDHFA